MRQELAARGQIVLTGDDFHFSRLILGGDPGAGHATPPPILGQGALGRLKFSLGDFSHALLGVFDGIAEPASVALNLLAQGDGEGYREVMDPCEELGRWLFQEPTRHYKAGLAFLAWLNGLQENFQLVNHEERTRDRQHYLRTAELAARAGAIADASLAAERLEAFASGSS